MKTSMSRFQIHDDLTAPEGSVPVLRGALAAGGQLPNFLGVLAGSPAALRAYASFRSELRHGRLTLATLERIALAVAEHYHSEPGIEMHSRAARAAGLALDEVAAGAEIRLQGSARGGAAALPAGACRRGGRPPMHLHEEAHEAGWDDEQILEAIAAVAMEGFTAMVNVAGEVPVDGSSEESRACRQRKSPASAAMGSHEQNANGEGRGSGCCPFYHEAVELVGRRWTGAILRVLMDGPMRFSEVAQAVPELSDRLLSERMKELEARGIVERKVIPGPPLRVEYQLSRMGRELEPALSELQRWANRWLGSASPPACRTERTAGRGHGLIRGRPPASRPTASRRSAQLSSELLSASPCRVSSSTSEIATARIGRRLRTAPEHTDRPAAGASRASRQAGASR